MTAKFSLTITGDTLNELLRQLAAPGDYVAAPPANAPTPAPTLIGVHDPAPAPTTTTVPASEVSALDERGMPWDGRIHAKSKTRNADGTWRYRRNTLNADIEKVEAEIKPAAAPMPHPVAAQPMGVGATAAPLPPSGESLRSTLVAVPTADPAPATTETAVAAVGGAVTYEQFVAMIVSLIKGGKLDPAKMADFWVEVGVEGANALLGNQPMIDKAYQIACLKC